MSKYNQAVDNKSAYEILNEKIEVAEQRSEEIQQMQQQAKEEKKAASKPETKLDRQSNSKTGRENGSIDSNPFSAWRAGLGGSTRRRRVI